MPKEVVDENAENQEKVYGNEPGDIPTPPKGWLGGKKHSTRELLGVLEKNGSFFKYEDLELSEQSTTQGPQFLETDKLMQRTEAYRNLENSVDASIYKLFGIQHDVEEMGDIFSKTIIKKTIPVDKNGKKIELGEKEKQQFYNMKYYIFSNLLGENPHLKPSESNKFAAKLKANLKTLDASPKQHDYLKNTSNVTKLTYILAVATKGGTPITNLNYIKDPNAEKALRSELGALLINGVDDYIKYSDKEAKNLDAGDELKLVKIGGSLAFLSVFIGMVALTAGVGAPMIVLTASFGVGAVAYLVSTCFAGRFITEDNYTYLFNGVVSQMDKQNFKYEGKAIELLGKVEALLGATKNTDHIRKRTLEAYKKTLEGTQEVQNIKQAPGFDKFQSIFVDQVNKINDAYNKKGFSAFRRKRITKKKQDDEHNSISKNNLKNEDTNQSITNKDFPNNLSVDRSQTYQINENTENLDELNNEDLRVIIKSKDNEINMMKNQIEEIQTHQKDNIKQKYENMMDYAYESRKGGASMSNDEVQQLTKKLDENNRIMKNIKRSKVDLNKNIVVTNEINNNHNEKIKTEEDTQKPLEELETNLDEMYSGITEKGQPNLKEQLSPDEYNKLKEEQEKVLAENNRTEEDTQNLQEQLGPDVKNKLQAMQERISLMEKNNKLDNILDDLRSKSDQNVLSKDTKIPVGIAGAVKGHNSTIKMENKDKIKFI